MGDFVPFGSPLYQTFLGVLLFGRSMDFLSTWVGSPNLVLEGNPIAKKLRWKWAIPLNLVICFTLAAWPLPAIIISTMSVLLAARNFQSAWLMRTLGEHGYREFLVAKMEEAPRGLFLTCLLAQVLLTSAVGAALVLASGREALIPFGIGMGIITYSTAILAYVFLALARHRRLYRF